MIVGFNCSDWILIPGKILQRTLQIVTFIMLLCAVNLGDLIFEFQFRLFIPFVHNYLEHFKKNEIKNLMSSSVFQTSSKDMMRVTIIVVLTGDS